MERLKASLSMGITLMLLFNFNAWITLMILSI